MTSIEKGIIAMAAVAGVIGVGLILFVIFYLVPML